MSSSAAVVETPKEQDSSGLSAVPEPSEGEGAADLYIEADGQITLIAGGRDPDESSIVLRGGEVGVGGQFEKGERVRFEIEGVVAEITFTDLMDRKTGDVTGTKRKHVMKLDGIKKVG